jgi:hypothetical protein
MKVVKILVAASLLASVSSAALAEGWGRHPGWNNSASSKHGKQCGWENRFLPCFLVYRLADDL